MSSALSMQYVLSPVSTMLTKQISRTLSSCMIEIQYALNSNSLLSPLLLPPALAATILLSLSLSLIAFDTLCKWNHAGFIFL